MLYASPIKYKGQMLVGLAGFSRFCWAAWSAAYSACSEFLLLAIKLIKSRWIGGSAWESNRCTGFKVDMSILNELLPKTIFITIYEFFIFCQDITCWNHSGRIPSFDDLNAILSNNWIWATARKDLTAHHLRMNGSWRVLGGLRRFRGIRIRFLNK